MNSKSIGNIGEAKAIMKFTELGIPVYLPFGDNERADMIIDVNGTLLKIQVKTSTVYKNGCARFMTSTQGIISNKFYKNGYDESEIDYFVFYSIPLDEIYMMHVTECTSNGVYIRKEEPKSQQKINIRKSTDYLVDNIVEQLINDEHM